MDKVHIDAITGLILAGGRGSRMGHVDKGLQGFRGRAMVAHVIGRLRPQVGSLMLNANQNLAAYANFGLPVLADELTGFAGPLAGLETGLRHCQTPYLVTAPCDSPFLPLNLVARLFASLSEQQADLAVAVTDGDKKGGAAENRRQPQPVFCLLKTALLPQLSAYLQNGGRKIESWYAPLAVTQVFFDDATAFQNINTPEQLRQLDGSDA